MWDWCILMAETHLHKTCFKSMERTLTPLETCCNPQEQPVTPMDVDDDVTSCTVDMETQDGSLDIQDGGRSSKQDSSMPSLLDESNRTLLNGNLASPSQESLPNGPSLVGAKPNGPISLLSGGVSPSAVSSEMDVLKPSDLLRGKSDSFTQKSKSDSGAIKGGLQSKNIVISTVNKHTGVIGTKVVTAGSQAAKVGRILD